jgi:hypothetical protein
MKIDRLYGSAYIPETSRFTTGGPMRSLKKVRVVPKTKKNESK